MLLMFTLAFQYRFTCNSMSDVQNMLSVFWTRKEDKIKPDLCNRFYLILSCKLYAVYYLDEKCMSIESANDLSAVVSASLETNGSDYLHVFKY